MWTCADGGGRCRRRTWPIAGIIDGVPANERAELQLTDDEALDSPNRQLIVELQSDARLSLAELGRRVGLSPPAVAERLRRLESDGIIAGYHAVIDPRRLGYGLGVLIRLRPAPRQIAAAAQLARDTPEVVEC